MTVQDLVNAALTSLGELLPGQQANPEESQMGVDLLNHLLSSWSSEHRKVYVIDNLQFPLVSGQGQYTMGPGGNFNSFRPVKIQSAGVVKYDQGDQIGLRKPLDLINSVAWGAIEEKGMQSREPLRLYNDNSYPCIFLNLWPIPLFP